MKISLKIIKLRNQYIFGLCMEQTKHYNFLFKEFYTAFTSQHRLCLFYLPHYPYWPQSTQILHVVHSTYSKEKWYFVSSFVVLTYCEKKCSSDWEKLLKFEAEGWEFPKCLRSPEQFIQTMKVQSNFGNRMLFNLFLEVSYI